MEAEMKGVICKDVATNFTLEEWALQDSSSQKLHRHVMQEPFRNLVATGTTEL